MEIILKLYTGPKTKILPHLPKVTWFFFYQPHLNAIIIIFNNNNINNNHILANDKK